jgi:hypothetical protein
VVFGPLQNVGPPADLAMSPRPLALRLPRKTPLMHSRAATAERDGAVMRRVDVASLSPSCNYYAVRKHSVPHNQFHIY